MISIDEQIENIFDEFYSETLILDVKTLQICRELAKAVYWRGESARSVCDAIDYKISHLNKLEKKDET